MLNTMPPGFNQTSALQAAHYPLTYLTSTHPSGMQPPGTQPGYQNLRGGFSSGMNALSQNPMTQNPQMMMAQALAGQKAV